MRRRELAGGRHRPELGAGIRRFLPRRFRGHGRDHAAFVPWSQIEPFVGHVPTSRLRLASRRLARLHPAQIADLVEAASHEQGEEILQAVGHDKELEADVFEELDDEHQVEFLRSALTRRWPRCWRGWTAMTPPICCSRSTQDRRIPVLNLMPAAKQLKIKRLLGYNPSTAGGLMNPDFASLPADATVAQALERVRASELAPGQLLTLWVIDAAAQLVGVVFASELIRAPATRKSRA